MREARDLLRLMRQLAVAERPAVVATIVAVEGSAYRREGARLLIEPDGALTGVLSGGCVERELLPPARRALADGRPRALRFDLSADEEAIWGFGLGCSGTITLLLEPLATAREPLERAYAESLEDRRAVRLTTRLRIASAPAASPDAPATVERLLEPLADPPAALATSAPPARPPLPLHWKPRSRPDEAPAELATPESEARAGDEPTGEHGLTLARGVGPAPAGEIVLVEELLPPVHLVVVGAERDVTPLLRLAVELGWQATVVDARPTPEAETRLAPFARYLGAAPRRLADVVTFDRRTAVLVASHRYLDDLAYLGELARAELGYLGLLGPVRRRERLLADLERQQGTEAARKLAAVRGPAGLDLRGRSPHEVALAVIAEVQAVLHGGSARPLAEVARGVAAGAPELAR